MFKFPELNTPKLLLIAFFESVTFYAAFDKIFFQENGLSLFQISILLSIFSVMLLMFEVPSGSLSDRWVRKYVLMLSLGSSILAMIFFATGDNFLSFALATVFMGFAFVFRSGTNSSLLFDSLKEVNATSQFEKYLAARRIIAAAGFAMASLLGGVIATTYGIAITFWMSLMLLIPALIIAVTLREPKFHKTTGEISYFSHIKKSSTYLLSQSYFRQVIALSVVIMTVQILIEDYSQLYFASLGISLVLIGVITTFSGIKEMVANYGGALLASRNNLATIYGVLLLIMSVSLILVAYVPTIIAILALIIASAMFFLIDVPLLGAFHKN